MNVQFSSPEQEEKHKGMEFFLPFPLFKEDEGGNVCVRCLSSPPFHTSPLLLNCRACLKCWDITLSQTPSSGQGQVPSKGHGLDLRRSEEQRAWGQAIHTRTHTQSPWVLQSCEIAPQMFERDVTEFSEMGDENPSIYLVTQEEGEERKPVRKAVMGCTRCQEDISARLPTLTTTVGTGNEAEARGAVQKASMKPSVRTQEDVRHRGWSGEPPTTSHNVLPPPQNPAYSRNCSASQAACESHQKAGIA